jgi:hypothetical protein
MALLLLAHSSRLAESLGFSFHNVKWFGSPAVLAKEYWCHFPGRHISEHYFLLLFFF